MYLSRHALLAALAIAAAACDPVPDAPAGRMAPDAREEPSAGPRRVVASFPGQASVLVADGADIAAFRKRLAGRGLRLRAYDRALGIASIEGADAAGRLGQDLAVAGAWADPPRRRIRPPGLRLTAAVVPPEPLEEAQWGLSSVGAQQAWQAGATGRDVRVAVLDTGIDPDNPDLAPNLDLSRSRSFVATEDLVDRNGHGSHVAGIIGAARNGIGVAGVAPECTLIAVKVLDKDTYGDDFGILQGIRYAADQGARIINLSLEDRLEWGTPAAGAAALGFSRAVRYAAMKGALVVAGAGNDGEAEFASGWTHIPAALPFVLGVSAVGPVAQRDFDAFAIYSNYGRTLVDVAAPGGGLAVDPVAGPYIADPADLVLSTWSTHALPHEVQGIPVGPAPWSVFAGTSMACAFASGVAALAVQVHPEPPQAVASRVMRTARGPVGRDPRYGSGIVDAYRAVVSR